MTWTCHTYATWTIEQGISPKVVQIRLRHSSTPASQALKTQLRVLRLFASTGWDIWLREFSLTFSIRWEAVLGYHRSKTHTDVRREPTVHLQLGKVAR